MQTQNQQSQQEVVINSKRVGYFMKKKKIIYFKKAKKRTFHDYLLNKCEHVLVINIIHCMYMNSFINTQWKHSPIEFIAIKSVSIVKWAQKSHFTLENSLSRKIQLITHTLTSINTLFVSRVPLINFFFEWQKTQLKTLHIIFTQFSHSIVLIFSHSVPCF